MLCNFCADIDLDLLATKEGYKHHPSCTSLLKSARDGCNICALIWNSQWKVVGGDIDAACDLGPLKTQIIARAFDPQLGEYHTIRYGQEIRFNQDPQNGAPVDENAPSEWSSGKVAFLWSFVAIATRNGDPAARFLKTRVVGQNDIEDQVCLASSWLKECLSTHSMCRPQSSEPISAPTRVINVGPSDGSRTPFLQDSSGEVHEWVTLSHRWGTVQPLRTTLKTLASHQAALPMETLPRLFQDAIFITRKMKYQYLWIDSLCIIQDSTADWSYEISRMESIFKYCSFMISAEFCHDSTESIFPSSVDLNYLQQACHVTKDGNGGTIAACSSDVRSTANRACGVLRSRAWVLQEDVLSPRTLTWKPHQLLWDCRRITRSEAEPSGRLISLAEKIWRSSAALKLVSLPQEMLHTLKQQQKYHTNFYEPMALWYTMLENFCSRQITVKADSLPAISGIAKEIRKHTGYNYYAGLWAQDLHNGLLWSTHGVESCRITRPSWSWAAMGNGIRINPAPLVLLDVRFEFLRPIANVVSVEVTNGGHDEFGLVTSGKLQLQGPCKNMSSCKQATIKLPSREQMMFSNDDVSPKRHKIYQGTICCWLDCCPWKELDSSSAAAELSNRGIVFIQIAAVDQTRNDVFNSMTAYHQERFEETRAGKTWALILEPAGDNMIEYRRLGIARISDELADGWDTQTVIII